MLEEFLKARGLQVPRELTAVYASPEARSLRSYIYWPDRGDEEVSSLGWALRLLREAAMPPPDNYLPLLPVDEMSIACLACAPRDVPDELPVVVRWHLADIDPRFQDSLLDTDVSNYVRSVAEELRARTAGLRNMARIAKRYHDDFVDKGIRPRGTVLRPVQLACQNVIIGMAALRHDATFDGLRVPTYLTCETPHVATHESNRAMAALILCDAFQNGGTMEIRFGDRGREEEVPPALRRFGRTIGVSLGTEDPHSITPREARDLFLAVTPMPDDLRVRSVDLIDRGIISPERLCYTLMSSVWSVLELDYLVATSTRVESILRGGAPVESRRHRQGESEVCRAAAMLGMLQRHIDNSDAAARSGSVRVFEDGSPRVSWSVRGDVGAVALDGIPPGTLPWASRDRDAFTLDDTGALICVARGLPTPGDHDLIRNLQAEHPGVAVALLIPADMADTVPQGIPLMVCPDRLAELDTDIERRLAMLRVGRL